MTTSVSYRERFRAAMGLWPVAQAIRDEALALLDAHVGQGPVRGVVIHGNYPVSAAQQALPEGPQLAMVMNELNLCIGAALPPDDLWTVSVIQDYDGGAPTTLITAIIDFIGHKLVSEYRPTPESLIEKGFVIQATAPWSA